MAENIVLQATKREVIGKQVRHLRGQEVIPAVLYGPGFAPIPLQTDAVALRNVLRQAGGGHLITLQIGDEQHRALVRQVQRHPIRGHILHVDFMRVQMDVTLRTEVRTVLTGKDYISAQGGLINHNMVAVEIECLPGNLPDEIPVDISVLKEIGDFFTVAQLPSLPGVEYRSDPNAIVVSTTFATQPELEEAEGEFPAEPELIRKEREDFDDEK